jgi:hypothetical protein
MITLPLLLLTLAFIPAEIRATAACMVVVVASKEADA